VRATALGGVLIKLRAEELYILLAPKIRILKEGGISKS